MLILPMSATSHRICKERNKKRKRNYKATAELLSHLVFHQLMEIVADEGGTHNTSICVQIIALYLIVRFPLHVLSFSINHDLILASIIIADWDIKQ